jgi:hypothetical protein
MVIGISGRESDEEQEPPVDSTGDTRLGFRLANSDFRVAHALQ